MRRPLSIRLIVGLLMAMPVIAISTTLVILSSATSHRIAEDLGQQLVDRATATVQADVREYLSSAVRLSDLYTLRIQRDELPTTGLVAWERAMFDDLITTPDVASICFGNTAGDSTWLLRHGDRLEVGRADGSRDHFAQEFVVDPANGIADLQHHIRTYQYDPRERPWYAAAMTSASPVWTPIYFWFGETGGDLETGTGYARVIRGPNDDFKGVLVIDVTLGALSGFLRRLSLAEHGFIFITDADHYLVASSVGEVNSSDGKRLLLRDHDHPAAREAANHLTQSTRPSDKTLDATRIKIDGEPSRMRVTAFHPHPGLNWNVITVIPERLFLAQAQADQRRAVLLGLVAVAGALALGWLLSRSICKPILQLRAHATRIGKGDFESRLHLTSAREWRDLSEDLNHMASDLKEHMELRQSLALANEVQQSLLPKAPPRVRGLDIAGHSQYCETTGGDYFDFVDVAELPLKQTVIAVGDVMGHGIASALLMASARAALRATALKEGSLGELMTRVNQVLARDARHNKFMTMALAVIDPVQCTMRWASAGHDPPMIYSPVRGGFREPEGGDIPLGLDASVTYIEYTVKNVEPGSIIVIGTDGVWEARSPAGELFGKDRLRDVIKKHAFETADGISHAINESLRDFAGHDRFPDDVTFVVIKLWLMD